MQTSEKKISLVAMPLVAIAAIILFISIFGLIVYDYREKRNDAVAHGNHRLHMLLDDKVEETLSWRSNLKQNASLVADIPFFAEQAHRYISGNLPKSAILAWMQVLKDKLHYDYVRLVDPSGKVLLSVTETPAALPSYGNSLLVQAFQTKEVLLSDVYLTQASDEPIISLFVPLFLPQQPELKLGAMVFCLRPTKPLHHIISNRTPGSASTETYLVRLDNQTIALPVSNNNTAAVPEVAFNGQDILTAISRTEQGESFTVNRSDGKLQLLAAKRVENTPWVMVSVMDLDELYSPIRQRFGIAMTSVLFMFTLVGGIALAWKKRQAQLAKISLHRLTLFAEQTRDIIFFVDFEGRIIEANRAAYATYGYSREELCALRVSDLVYKGPISKVESHDSDDSLFETAQSRKDGSFFLAEVRWQKVTIDHETISVFVIRDLTQRKAAEQQLAYISTHDSLTGLSNRRLLSEYLEQAVKLAKSGKAGAMLLIDVDNFKLINDTLGHTIGDALLREMVDFIRGRLRDCDQFSRLGGDEFAIILSEMSTEDVKAFAEGLRRSVEQMEVSFDGSCSSVAISISIGVVLIDGSLESQKVLSQADFAVQLAKDKGRNRVVFAKRETRGIERLSEAGEVLRALRTALKDNGFTLHFQPVVHVKDQRIAHYEALIRLQDANGSPISPATFIPIAETFGLMPNIDRWVIQQTIVKLMQHRDLKIFVNISGVSFGDDELIEFIKTAISNAGVEPNRIGFEITETAAVADLTSAVAWVSELSALGCSFALDDFGIGFSSFSYVSNFPVEYIKIDGSYVCDMDVSEKHRTIVEAIVQVAHSLGKQVIAEHVENRSVLEMLCQMRVSCAQGYHTGRPSPWLPGEDDALSGYQKS